MMPSDAFKALVEQLFASPFSDDFAEMRAAYQAMGDALPVPDGVTVTAGVLGGRPCEWMTANDRPAHAVLMLHGGGYCIGGLASHRHLGAELARGTGARVASLDYRLAPEHPFPAGLDDAVAAYRQLAAEAPDDGRIALAGDSAGAGLTMALLARILQSDLPRPAAIYCMSPWVDLTNNARSRTLKAAVDPLANTALLGRMASAYAGPVPLTDPAVSPMHANFRGAPPVFIQVGTAEVLMDDAINLAKALGDADVDVDLEIRADMVHVWPWFFPAIPEGAQAIERACHFLSWHLNGVS